MGRLFAVLLFKLFFFLWSGAAAAETLIAREAVAAKDLLDRAKQFLEQGHLAEAEALIRQRLEQVPADVAAHYWLGRVLLKRQRPVQALPHLEQALRALVQTSSQAQAIGRERVLQTLVVAASQAGQTERARTVLAQLAGLPHGSRYVREVLNRLGYTHGLRALRSRRLDEAEVIFSRLLELVPHDPLIHLNLAQLYQQRAQWQRAESAYRQVLEVRPGEMNALLGLARVLAQTRRLEEAIELAESIVRRGGNLPQVLEARGLLNRWYDRLVRERVAAFVPSAGEAERLAAVELARKLLRHKRLDQAQTLLEAVLEQDPGNARAHYWLGRVFLQRKQVGEGLAGIERSAQLDPGNLKLKMALARAYENAGREEDAALVYETVATRDKNGKLGQEAAKRLDLWRAKRMQEEGRQQEALELYETLRARYPEDRKVSEHLAHLYEKMGQEAQADQLYQTLQAQAPRDINLRLRLALVYEKRGDEARFLDLLSEILRLDPPARTRRWVLDKLGLSRAEALLAEDKVDEVLPILEHVRSLAPDAARVHFSLGVIYQRQGRYGKAEGLYRRVLELDEGHLEARRRLGQVYIELGRVEEAIGQYEEVLRRGGRGSVEGREAERILKTLYGREAERLLGLLRDGEESARESGILLGKKLLRRGELDEAEALLVAVVEGWPDDAQGRYWLGQLYLRRGREEEGIGEIERSVELAPENERLRLELGKAYERVGRLEEAEGLYEGLLRGGEESVVLGEARRRLGMLRARRYTAAGDEASAVAEYEALRQLFPDDRQILSALVVLYEKQEAWEELRSLLERQLELTPNDLAARSRLVAVYQRLGRSEDARRQMAAVIQQAPRSPLARKYLEALGFKEAESLLNGGHLEAARTRFEALQALVPDHPGVLFYLATIHYRQKAYAEAERLYKRVLELRPGHLDTQFLLAQLYEDSGREFEALKRYRRLAQMAGGNKRQVQAARENHDRLTRKLIEHGRELLRKEELDEAQRLFESLLDQQPNNAQAHFWLSRVYSKRKDFAEAVRALEASVKLAPANMRLRRTLAQAYLDAGLYEKAEQTLQEVLQQVPFDLDAHLLLARVYERQGESSSAEQQLLKLLELGPSEDLRLKALNLLGLARAKELLQEGRTAQALEILQRLQRVVPDDPVVNFHLAEALHREGISAEAEVAYRKALEAGHARPALVQLKLADLLLEEGREDEAIERFNLVLERHPHTPEARQAESRLQPIFKRRAEELLVHLSESGLSQDEVLAHLREEARHMLEGGGIEGARLLYKAMLNRSPDAPDALYGLARTHLRQDSFDNAIVLLKRSVEQDPANTTYREALAQAYLGVRRYGAALRLVEELLEEDPERLEWHLLAAQIYRAQGRPRAAEPHLGRVLQGGDEEQVAQALSWLGFDEARELLQQNKLREALRILRRIEALEAPQPEVHFSLGVIYQRQGRYGKAEGLYRRVLELDEGHLEARRRLGQVYIELGRVEEAIGQYEEVLRRGGRGSVEGREAERILKTLYGREAERLLGLLRDGEESARESGILLGKKLLRRGELDEAEALLVAVVEGWPDDAQGRYWLGQLYLRRGREEEGIGEIERSVELAPENERLRLELGKAYERVGRLEEAEGLYEGLLRGGEESVVLGEARRRLGMLRARRYTAAGDEASAVAEYEALRQLFPEDPRILGLLGWSYLRLGRTAEADALFEQVLALAPGDVDVHMRMAEVYRQRGERRRYLEQLSRIIELDPYGQRGRRARDQLGFAEGMRLFQQGDLEGAKRIFRRMLTVAPRDPETLYRLGAILQHQRQWLEAERVLRRALELDPDNINAGLKLAQVYLGMNRIGRAIEVLEAQVKPGDDSIQGKAAREMLAKLYAQQAERLRRGGEIDFAIQGYRDLLRYDPENAAARFNLALLLLTRGRADDALVQFEEVARLAPDSKTHRYMAGIHNQAGRYVQAVNHFARAIALERDEARARDDARRLGVALARHFLQEDRPLAALRALEGFKSEGNADARVNYYLGVIYRQQGDIKNSIAAFREAVQLDPDNINLRFNLAILYERDNEDQLALVQYREILKRGKPGNNVVERARRRITVVENRLRRFTSLLTYSVSEGKTLVEDLVGQREVASSFNSVLNYNLATRFRPTRQTLIRINTGFSYASNHTTESDSLVPRLGIAGTYNTPDRFLSLGATYFQSHGLLLDSFAGRGINVNLNGGLRLTDPLAYFHDLLRRKERQAPAAEEGIERSPVPHSESPPPPVEEPDTSRLRQALQAAYERLIPPKKERFLLEEVEEARRYVVAEGDTLWDISEKLLLDPFLWPEIWQVNPEIENPHLIYPGDVITLIFIGGRPVLRVERGQPPLERMDLSPVEMQHRAEQIRQKVAAALRLYETGLDMLREEDYEAAREAFEKLARVVPDDPDVNLGLGIAYRELGQYSRAEQALLKVLAAVPRQAEALLQLARLYSTQDRLEEAIERVQTLLEVALPDSPRTQAGMVLWRDLLARQIRQQLAQPLLDEADIAALVAEGVQLLALEDLERAEGIFRQILERFPDHAASRYWLAHILWRQGRSAEALVQLEQAARLQPAAWSYQYLLGEWYARQGRWQDSEQAFLGVAAGAEDARLARAARHRAALAQAQSLRLAGDPAAALGIYLRLLENTPEEGGLLRRLGDVYRELGQPLAAIEAYEAALLQPELAADIDLHLALADLYARLGNRERLVVHARQVLALEPTPVQRRRLLDLLGLKAGLEWLRQGRLKEALELLEQVLAVVPGDALTQLNVAVIHMEEGRHAEAEALLQQILEADPRNLTARLRLGMLYKETGRVHKAIVALERVVEEGRGTAAGVQAAEQLEVLETERLKRLTIPELEESEPLPKTLSAGLSFRDFDPTTALLTETRSWRGNLRFIYPSLKWGNWAVGYAYTNTDNEHPLGTDYAFTAHELDLGYARPIPGVPRVFANISLARRYQFYSHPDTNARFALGLDAKRRTLRDSVTVGFSYRAHDDLTLNANYSYSETRANLPAGLVYDSNGFPVARQSLSLGDFSASYFTFSVQLRF